MKKSHHYFYLASFFILVSSFFVFYILTVKSQNSEKANNKLPKIERNDRSEIIYTFEPKIDTKGNSYLVIQMSFRGDNSNVRD